MCLGDRSLVRLQHKLGPVIVDVQGTQNEDQTERGPCSWRWFSANRLFGNFLHRQQPNHSSNFFGRLPLDKLTPKFSIQKKSCPVGGLRVKMTPLRGFGGQVDGE